MRDAIRRNQMQSPGGASGVSVSVCGALGRNISKVAAGGAVLSGSSCTAKLWNAERERERERRAHPIKSHQGSIKSNHAQSRAIKSHPEPSRAIQSHPEPSRAIQSNPEQSRAITCGRHRGASRQRMTRRTKGCPSRRLRRDRRSSAEISERGGASRVHASPPAERSAGQLSCARAPAEVMREVISMRSAGQPSCAQSP